MVNMENYEEYMLLEADGELNETEQQELYAFIEQHPELKDEMALYMATRMVPDTTQVYEGKEELLKKGPAQRTIDLRNWWVYGAAAACIGILLFTTLGRPGQDTATTHPVAVKEETAPVKDTTPNAAIAQPDIEELHSTPKDPIALETKKEEQKTQVKQTPRKVQPVIKEVQQQAPQPVIVKQAKPIQQLQPEDHPMPVVTKKDPVPMPVEEQAPAIAHEQEDTPVTTPAKNEGFLASLPVSEERVAGFNELSSAVNEKIEKVKSIRKKIKDTDVSFKVGNKELFTVRL